MESLYTESKDGFIWRDCTLKVKMVMNFRAELFVFCFLNIVTTCLSVLGLRDLFFSCE